MTSNLVAPSQCSVALIDEVVKERALGSNAAYFSGIHIGWRALVAEYVTNQGSPELIQAWPLAAANSGVFKNLYAYSDEKYCHVRIIKGLRERTLDYCPACGEDGTPNTLDHYLPQKVYPEYAISPINLSPMCDICQGHKLEKTVDGDGGRIFLHPYFDTFLAHRVLEVEIAAPFESPTFSLNVVSSVLAPNRDVVARHIAELKLHARYATFLEKEYIRLLRLCADSREVGVDVRLQLPIWARNAKRKAENSWNHILYASVLGNQALVIYLAEGKLPEML